MNMENNDHHQANQAQQPGNTSIARIVEPRAQQIKPLEERRLIHHDGAAHRHVDVFRELRTRLLSLGGNDNFITMIAPISPGSGGSFVACNLAAAFAFHASKSALLVDCNLRDPSQHVNLRVDASGGGLIEYLDQQRTDADPIIYPTGIPDLELIPAGRLTHISAEYFSSGRMRDMIGRLRQEDAQRHIFIDAPAVTASPDARILSELVDFVVLVVGSGKDTPERITKAVSNFHSDKLAGLVFNELP